MSDSQNIQKSISLPVFLIGFMGSGKTTTGRELAMLLGYDFADLDLIIEQTGKNADYRDFCPERGGVFSEN
jgi:shikimate kinase